MNRLFGLIFMLLIFSCKDDKLTINGLDQKQFDESVDAMQRDLPSDQMPKLREAIKIIYTYDTHQDTDSLKWSRTRQILNMKNADQIFTIAEASAYRHGLDWDRNSLGPLDFSKVRKSGDDNKDNSEKDKNLKEIQNINVSTREIDQNKDGVNDALMVFVNFLDGSGREVDFQDADIDGNLSVFNNNEKVYTKNQKISNSNMGNSALLRGIILPYAAFDAEKMTGDKVSISVKASTPFNSFTSESSEKEIGFEKFKKHSRVDQEAVNKEKENAKNVVVSFLNDVGAGNLEQAHQYSVNPEWRDFKNFKSKDLGFGAVKGAEIQSVEVKDFDPAKEKATVDARYTFDMNDEVPLELHKNFYLQKIAGEWKIVDTKKIN